MEAGLRLQTKIWLTYSAFLGSWLCFIIMVQMMNPPQRSVSRLVLVAFLAATVYAIVSGSVARKKFLAQSREVLRDDPQKAATRWKAAHFIGFSCAMSVTVFGVALKFLGAGWQVAGVFFVIGLGLLVLWRPLPNRFALVDSR